VLQIARPLQEAESALNTDRKLAESFAKAGNVVLPLLFTFGEPRGKPDSLFPNSWQERALDPGRQRRSSAVHSGVEVRSSQSGPPSAVGI